MKEESRFGSEYSYGVDEVFVSPLFVLSKMFDENTLKNQILALVNLDYDDIVNIRNINEVLARKMERMYQVEMLLRKNCVKFMKEKSYSIMYIYKWGKPLFSL